MYVLCILSHSVSLTADLVCNHSLESHVNDAIKLHVNDAMKSHVNDAMESHVNDAMKSHVNDAMESHVNDAMESHVNDAMKSHVNDAMKSHDQGSRNGRRMLEAPPSWGRFLALILCSQAHVGGNAQLGQVTCAFCDCVHTLL